MGKKNLLSKQPQPKLFSKLIYFLFETLIYNISRLKISKYKKYEIYNVIKDFIIHYISEDKASNKDFKKEIKNFLFLNFRHNKELSQYNYNILKKFARFRTFKSLKIKDLLIILNKINI